MTGTTLASLLIVDDEQAQMRALCETLEVEGYRTTGFTSAKAALAALRQQTFDLVLSDLMMPEMDGIALLDAALEADPNLVGIVMTGHGTIDTAVKAMQTGALDYILKPFKLSAVLLVLSRALAARRLRMENIQLHEAVEIHKLSVAIAFATGLDEVLERVTGTAIALSGVRSVFALLRSPEGNSLYVAATGGEAGLPAGSLIPLDNALSGWVAEKSESLSRQDEIAAAQQASAAPLQGIPAGISIPMLAGGTLIGILSVTAVNPEKPVAAGQIKTLNILASAAASALGRVTLVERLRGAEQRYRRLAENAPDIVFRYDLHPRPGYSYVNPAVLAVTGYSPEEHYADPRLSLRMVEPDDRPLLETLLRGECPSGKALTLRYMHRSGKTIWLEHRTMLVQDGDGRPVAIEGIARDITERRVLEEQLRHSQKIEAIGLLAGGIAHDFNNLLTVINGYANLILLEDKPAPELADKVDQIVRAGDHAAALTRQLLAFGRKQILQPRVLNLNTAVQRSMKLLRRLIGEDIALLANLDPRLGPVEADPDQMEQIIFNLAVNSRDAMPQGGTLTIETRNAGSRVILVLSDTGCGMDEATQFRVFEPFFTTKELGKGTGLGLSIVYGAVRQSNGDIRIISAPGKGATFEISLPRAEELVAGPASCAAAAGTPGGSETILLVEDDQSVRKFIAGVLRKGGYQVLDACDGDDALQVCRQSGDQAALVLTDLVMPGLSGTTLIEKLKDLNPAIRAVYMSGHARHSALSGNFLDPALPFLHKPFTPDTLLRIVRETLDRTV